MSGIFLSYRRQDATSARALCMRLREHFGERAVFFDLDCVPAGQDVLSATDRAVDACAAMVVLVGRDWNQPTAGGGRELSDRDDPVRRELAAALSRGKPVYPVLVESATMPREVELPRRLQPFARREALALDRERFEFGLGRIVRALEADVETQGTRGPRAPRPLASTVAAHAPASARASAPSPRAERGPFAPIPHTPARLEKRKRELAEQRRRARERREAVRRQSPSFYQHAGGWVTALVNAGACIGAVALGEWLVAGAIDVLMERGPVVDTVMRASALALALGWALMFSAVSALFYHRDPSRGSAVFVSRGLLGGWTLAVADYAFLGFSAAWPLAPAVGWVLARAIAAAAALHLGVGFEGIGVATALGYTALVGGIYLKLSLDESEP